MFQKIRAAQKGKARSRRAGIDVPSLPLLSGNDSSRGDSAWGEHCVCPGGVLCELLCLPGSGFHAALSHGAALGLWQCHSREQPLHCDLLLSDACALVCDIEGLAAQVTGSALRCSCHHALQASGSPSADRQWCFQSDSRGVPLRGADTVPQGGGPCALLQQPQFPPSCMCRQHWLSPSP